MAATGYACCSAAEIVAGGISFLGAIVAKLGVITSLDLHYVPGVIQLILYALAQGAIDSQRVGDGAIPVEVGSQQDAAFYLDGMFRRELGGHGPAHGVACQIPALNAWTWCIIP